MKKLLLICLLFSQIALADYLNTSGLYIASSDGTAITADQELVAAPGAGLAIEVVYVSLSLDGTADVVGLTDGTITQYQVKLADGGIYAHNFKDGEWRLPANQGLDLDMVTAGSDVYYTVVYKIVKG